MFFFFLHGTELLTLTALDFGLMVHFWVLFCAIVSSRAEELHHLSARL